MALMLANCSFRQKTQLTTQYEYDDKGRLVSIISPDSSKMQMKYNEMGLPLEIHYPNGSIQYGYDDNGNRIWMEDDTGISEYYYDVFDRLVGVIWQHKLRQLITYTYDAFDNLTGLEVFNLELMKQNSKYKDQLELLTSNPSEKVQKQKEQKLLLQQVMDMLENEDEQGIRNYRQYSVRYGYDVLGNITGIYTNGESILYFSPIRKRKLV